MKKPECHLSGLPQVWLISALGQGEGFPKGLTLWVTFHPSEPLLSSRSHLQLVWLSQAPSQFIVSLLSSLYKQFSSVKNTVNISATSKVL